MLELDPNALGGIGGIEPPASGQVEYSDRDVVGLRLRVGAGGTKTWILRARAGKSVVNRKLGTWPEMALPVARSVAEVSLRALKAQAKTSLPEPTYSPRIRRLLDYYGLKSVYELASVTAVEILRAPNLGRTSLKEINAILAQQGLSIGCRVDHSTPAVPVAKDGRPPFDIEAWPTERGIIVRIEGQEYDIVGLLNDAASDAVSVSGHYPPSPQRDYLEIGLHEIEKAIEAIRRRFVDQKAADHLTEAWLAGVEHGKRER